MDSYLPLHDRSHKARDVALEWIDDRIDTLQGDLGLVETDEGRLMVEHWIEDLEEAGRRLSILPNECKKYKGKWNSKAKICRVGR